VSWPLKYRPKSLEEVINQEDVKSALREWMESWVKGKPQSKAVMLYGRPGAGKTTLVPPQRSAHGLHTGSADQ